MNSASQLPYRRGVGLCLFNAEGLVLVAERRDRRGAWQMPQGGVQKGEEPTSAARRELKEEIGTDNAEIIARVPEKLRYEFPDWMQHTRRSSGAGAPGNARSGRDISQTQSAPISEPQPIYEGGVFHGKYRGQEQDWFALRFLGSDSEIDLSGEHEPENPEFIAWKWIALVETPRLIVDFKRAVYERLVKEFAPLAESIRRGETLPVWKG